jgi:hypothetical protein
LRFQIGTGEQTLHDVTFMPAMQARRAETIATRLGYGFRTHCCVSFPVRSLLMVVSALQKAAISLAAGVISNG